MGPWEGPFDTSTPFRIGAFQTGNLKGQKPLELERKVENMSEAGSWILEV